MSLRTIKNVAIGVGVTGIVAYLFGFFSGKKGETPDTNEEYEEALDETTSKPSFKDYIYTTMADALKAAMNTGNPFNATDEEEIYIQLAILKNDADWFKLNTAFGNYFPGTWDYTSWTPKVGNLTEWLTAELDSSEMKKVRTILSKIGVTI